MAEPKSKAAAAETPPAASEPAAAEPPQPPAAPAPEAEAEEDTGREVALCPNCDGELVKHAGLDPQKAGAWHCNTCGACWAPGRHHLREGTPVPDGWPKD